MGINWGNMTQGGLAGGALFGLPGAIGGGLLGGLFGGDEDEGYRDANRLLEQLPEHLRPYFEPYINAGKKQLPELEDQYGQLTNKTGDVLSRLGGGFKEDPGYKWMLNQGEQAITNAQAADGMLGTPQHQQMAGEMASNLANQQYQNYLNHAFGLYRMGLSGSQELYNNGQKAAEEYGTDIGNTYGGRSDLAYQHGANRNQANNSLFSNIFSYLGGKNNK